METETENKPARSWPGEIPTMGVYVADLGAYNAGKLRGAWVELEGMTDADEIREAIETALKEHGEPGAEEWAIHDYAGIPSSFGEWPDFEALAKYLEAVEEMGDQEVVDAWIRFSGEDVADVDAIREAYQGTFRDLESWAEDFLEQTEGLEGVPEHLRNYIDFEAYGKDAEIGGDIWTTEGGEGVLVFWNH